MNTATDRSSNRLAPGLYALLSAIVLAGGAAQSTSFAAGPPPPVHRAASDLVIATKTGITSAAMSDAPEISGTRPIAGTDVTGLSLIFDGTGTLPTSAQVSGRIYAANESDLDLPCAVAAGEGGAWSRRVLLSDIATKNGSAADVLVDLETNAETGSWVAVWSSAATLDRTIGADLDVSAATSTDDGEAWSTPLAVNAFAAGLPVTDEFAQLATDRVGTWMAVWASKHLLGGIVGADFDVVLSIAREGGMTWRGTAALDSTATAITAAP